jgi:signal transduction histidine kinase/ActR/RegA family two-component response regulator
MKIFTHAANQEFSRLLVSALQTAGLGSTTVNSSPHEPHLLSKDDIFVVWLAGSLESAASGVAEWRRAKAAPAQILAIGSWTHPSEIGLLLESGADDYLPEPLQPEALAVRVRVLAARALRNSPDALQKTFDERLGQSQKIDTLTTLAGTLAHDFNNILAAILGNAELAMLDLSTNASTRYNLEQIDKASRRAADITRQMLTYSGRSPSAAQAVNLSDLVKEMAELLRTSISKRCTIHYHFEPGLPRIVGDSAQLRQVVMNLLINASEAMGGKNGEIHVRTGLRQNGAEAWSTLEIEDNGSGMSEQTLQHIFDPFFTTKPSGRGLGLAAVQGIVRAHKGDISVESKPGQGSVFRLHFPVAREVASLLENPVSELSDWHGTGSILLIDDEDAVREAARRMLKKAGFEILEAANGDEGAEMFCRYASELNAVILDLNMPGLDGFEVYEVIREVRPDMRVVVWSGVDEAEARERLQQIGNPVILEKPTSARELAATLKRVLSPEPVQPASPLNGNGTAGVAAPVPANVQPAAQ